MVPSFSSWSCSRRALRPRAALVACAVAWAALWPSVAAARDCDAPPPPPPSAPWAAPEAPRAEEAGACGQVGEGLGRTRGKEAWGGEDWAYASLSGAGAVVLGGLMLGLLALTADDDDDDAQDDAQDDNDAEANIALLVGGLAFVLGGPAIGATLYGDSQGFNGAWWGAVLGQLGGMALTVGASYLFAEGLGMDPESTNYLVAVTLSGAVLIPLGATAGYYQSIRAPAPSVGASAGLLHITPEGEARLGLALPRLSVAPERDDVRVQVPLLGGRF